MKSTILISGALIIFAGSIKAELVVHEWGTFTALVGSNGLTQHGMYHEDEPLPEFVHEFGETKSMNTRLLCRRGKGCMPQAFLEKNNITLKMETPVIYFYTDKQRELSVNINFPAGVLTETFPAPVETFPTRMSEPILAHGNTTFKVNIMPTTKGKLPVVAPGNIYEHAREVNSNLVVSGDEQEKFIFYRGLGRFEPRVSVSSADGNLTLKAPNQAYKPTAAFLVHVDQRGHGQMLDAQSYWDGVLSASLIAQLSDHTRSTSNTSILTMAQARTKLIDSLKAAGLFDDEAKAMINTWENGYLKIPGLRLLYLLPVREIDEILPLEISPSADIVKRVFVARVEILLDNLEEKILNDIIINRENFSWAQLGRFAEPILRRVAGIYNGTDIQIENILAEFIKQASQE